MKGSHSVLFNVEDKPGSICSQNHNFLLARDKSSPWHQPGFLRSDENVIFNTLDILVLVCPVILQTQRVW